MAHLVQYLFVFDFVPPEGADSNSCIRCGYVPPSRATGVHEIDLWAAGGIVADEASLPGLVDQDGRLDVQEDEVVWVVMCGLCLNGYRDAGAELPCVPFYVETSD